MPAIAVIGAQFGDEGKGLTTDYFAAPHGPNCMVVRFCGGAQAGHTVVNPDGKRHVFHHFGAGSFVGSSTFLSRYFVVNPFVWHDEIKEFPVTPSVFVDPEADLTTPYDMLINQEVEYFRKSFRHGSCGRGVNETVERNSRNILVTKVSDIDKPKEFEEKLRLIRSEYITARMKEHKCPISEWLDGFLRSDNILKSYLECVKSFRKNVVVCGPDFISNIKQVVFEGAQGLLLDEDHRFFPHVTRAKTGLCNVVKIAEALGISEVEAVYVTRAYMTRHGAGPFPTEDPSLSYADSTNVNNEFQGGLRFGHLDLDLMKESVQNDLSSISSSKVSVSCSVAVTCLDQVGDSVKFKLGDEHIEDLASLPKIIGATCGADRVFTSYGPTRETMSQIQTFSTVQ